MNTVTVIGAGVSGLTCAVRLLEAGYRVTIVSKERIRETTSSVAAALWFPFRAYPLEKVIDWSMASLGRFEELEQEPDAGITTREVTELYRHLPPPPGWRARLDGFRKLSEAEIPRGFEGGYAIRAPVIDSSHYLPYLLDRATLLGAIVEMRDVENLWGVGKPSDIVVNCSGTGARALANDPSVVPIRGQIVRVAREAFQQVVVDEGSVEASYIVPRRDDCILGTTVEEGSWNRDPADESTREILGRCAELDPRVREVQILEARVGLRPGRPEIRLEATDVGGRTVIHNYGHGGSGFTLSWGCADEVLRLVESLRR